MAFKSKAGDDFFLEQTVDLCSLSVTVQEIMQSEAAAQMIPI